LSKNCETRYRKVFNLKYNDIKTLGDIAHGEFRHHPPAMHLIFRSSDGLGKQ